MIRVTILQKLKNFTCKVNDKKRLKKIDDVRTEIFMEKYKPNIRWTQKIVCQKKPDASMMLPCEHIFLNKIRRTKFVAKIWMPLIEALSPNNSPLTSGWQLVNKNYQLLDCLKVIYHQTLLILHTNVKNMMVSTVFYFCCFLIAFFVAYLTFFLHK